jgi:hypothetical protein
MVFGIYALEYLHIDAIADTHLDGYAFPFL